MRVHRSGRSCGVGNRWIVSGLVGALSIGLAFPVLPAGAATMGDGAKQHTPSPVAARSAPIQATLTRANASVSRQGAQFSNTYTDYPVTVNTSCGNSDSFVCFNMAGLGSFTTTGTSPFQPGQTYEGPTLTVTAGGQTCGEFQTTKGGYRAAMEVDQFVFNQGIDAFAAQLVCVNANVTIFATIAYKMTNSTPHHGYYLYDDNGVTTNFGNDGFLTYLGDPGYFALNQPVVGMATTPGGGGYWMTAADGGVFSFGDAHFYGSTGNIHLNKPIIGMAATPDGKGYWFVASDGGVFSFGDAHFYGSTGNIHLNKPIIGMAATPDGKGYWMTAADGGVFSFGDAHFYGSTGNVHLNRPITGMAATPDGKGYWFVAADGGIFAFGDAHFYGSTGNVHLDQPITGMLPSPDGHGYLMVANDGGLFAFGDAHFEGSLGGAGVTGIVGLAR